MFVALVELQSGQAIASDVREFTSVLVVHVCRCMLCCGYVFADVMCESLQVFWLCMFVGTCCVVVVFLQMLLCFDVCMYVFSIQQFFSSIVWLPLGFGVQVPPPRFKNSQTRSGVRKCS